jgi:hypothetical protein
MLEHGQTDTSGPLRQRMKGIEVEQVPIFACGGNTEDIFQWLGTLIASGQRLDL